MQICRCRQADEEKDTETDKAADIRMKTVIIVVIIDVIAAVATKATVVAHAE